MSRAALGTRRLLVLAGVLAALGAACSSHGAASSAPAAVSGGGASGPGGTTGGGLSALEPGTTPAPYDVRPGVPQIGPSVVKDAHVSVEVQRGKCQDAFDAATTIATRNGGFVESSATQGARSHSGRLRPPQFPCR